MDKANDVLNGIALKDATNIKAHRYLHCTHAPMHENAELKKKTIVLA
jgi:hypothetical protein